MNKTQKKQLIILAIAIAFMIGALAFRFYRASNINQRPVCVKNCCKKNLSATEIVRQELAAMNSMAALLEEIFKSGKIDEKDSRSVARISMNWKELMKLKKNLPSEERVEALKSLKENPEEVLERMHKAQAAIMTMPRGKNLMLIIKAILDGNPEKEKGTRNYDN
jgi:hypothetical protein